MKALRSRGEEKEREFCDDERREEVDGDEENMRIVLGNECAKRKADSLIEIGLCLRQCSSNEEEEEEEEEESKECRSICCKAVESALESVQFSVPDMFSPTTVVSNATTKSITRARSMLLWLLGEFGASGFIEGAPVRVGIFG